MLHNDKQHKIKTYVNKIISAPTAETLHLALFYAFQLDPLSKDKTIYTEEAAGRRNVQNGVRFKAVNQGNTLRRDSHTVRIK
jgi:hypothetical protein